MKFSNISNINKKNKIAIKHPPISQNVEETNGDKREKSEDDGQEEEENGWWAERVVGALGGLGDYGDTWYRSHAHLLHGDGPLPHTWRLYIAALVGGVSSCKAHCLTF